jgi:predicted metal-dependent hydrolase
MIDESIIEYINELSNRFNKKGLINLMVESECNFYNRELKNSFGFATYDSIYLDVEELKLYSEEFRIFVILHELCHYKNMKLMGLDGVIDLLSIDDFDVFCSTIIKEEILADRYACYVYQVLNKISYPRVLTQNLHLKEKQIRYTDIAKRLYGIVQNDKEKYKKLIEKFLK